MGSPFFDWVRAGAPENLPPEPVEPIAPVAAPPAPVDPVRQAIRDAAAASGVSEDYLLRKGELESSLNPTARAPTSSATGLYQFTDGTWLDQVRRNGQKYGIDPRLADDPVGRQRVLDMRNDPNLSASFAADYTNQNKQVLNRALGRDPDDAELYMAHFLGPGGATRFLRARDLEPGRIAAEIMPEAAAANRAVFYDERGQARSVADVDSRLRAKFGTMQRPSEVLAAQTPPAIAAAQGPASPAAAATPAATPPAAAATPADPMNDPTWVPPMVDPHADAMRRIEARRAQGGAAVDRLAPGNPRSIAEAQGFRAPGDPMQGPRQPYYVEVPDLGTVEFPGEMTPDQVTQAIRKQFPQHAQSILAAFGNSFAQGATKVIGENARPFETNEDLSLEHARQATLVGQRARELTDDEATAVLTWAQGNLRDTLYPQFQRAFMAVRQGQLDPARFPNLMEAHGESNAFRTFREAVQGFGKEQFPVAPERAGEFIPQVGQGLGTSAAFLTTRLIPGVGQVALPMSAMAQGGAEAIESAVTAGATNEQIGKAGGLGTVPGALDVASIENLLRGFERKPGAWGLITAVLRKAIEQGLIEGAQEGLQQIGQNLIAQGLYDPARGTLAEVPENILVGAAVGALTGGLAAPLTSKTAPAGAPATPGAAPAPAPAPGVPGAPGAPTAAPVAAGPAYTPSRGPNGEITGLTADANAAPQPGSPSVPPSSPESGTAPAQPVVDNTQVGGQPQDPLAQIDQILNGGGAPAPVAVSPPAIGEAKIALQQLLDDPRPLDEIVAAQAEATERAKQDLLEQAAATAGVNQRGAMIRIPFPEGAAEGQVDELYMIEDAEGRPVPMVRIIGQDPRVGVTTVYDGPIEDLPQASPVTGDGTKTDPRVVSTPEDLTAAAQQVDPAPTTPQVEAGNAKLGHLKWNGIEVAIETAKGGTRFDRANQPPQWSVPNFPAHYGYVKAATGADGEKIDVYIGEHPESAGVYVIDQIDPKTGQFDEHKVMLGFSNDIRLDDTPDWMAAYNGAFPDGSGPQRIGAVTPMTVDQFKEWLKNGKTREPLKYKNPANPYGTPEAPNREKLAEAFAQEFYKGRRYQTIVQARQHARQLLGDKPIPKESLKAIDEAIELGVVLRARNWIARPGSDITPRGIYRELVHLYTEQQPNLSQQTSTSVKNQAYSTPVPLAYIATWLSGLNPAKTVYEPTAGNGALLINASTFRTLANEIDPARRAALEAQGFRTVMGNDATTWRPEGQFDVVIANPPFGITKEADGTTTKSWKIDERYTTTQLDHVVALKALEAMKDDGSAVLIIAGINAENRDARSHAYNGKLKAQFFITLMEQYNVVDIFTVDGDLYKRQGAGWPVDVVVIRGRGKSARKVPAVDVPKIIKSWDELGGYLNAQYADRRPVVVGPAQGPGVAGAPGVRDHGGTRPGGTAGLGQLPPAADGPDSLAAPSGGRPGGSGAAPGAGDGRGGPVARPPAGGQPAGSHQQPRVREHAAPQPPKPADERPAAASDQGGRPGSAPPAGGNGPVGVAGQPGETRVAPAKDEFESIFDDEIAAAERPAANPDAGDLAGRGAKSQTQPPSQDSPRGAYKGAAQSGAAPSSDPLADIDNILRGKFSVENDDAQYQALKSPLTAALEPLLAQTKDLAAAFRALVQDYVKRFGPERVTKLRDVLVRFGREVKAGIIKLKNYVAGEAPQEPAGKGGAYEIPKPRVLDMIDELEGRGPAPTKPASTEAPAIKETAPKSTQAPDETKETKYQVSYTPQSKNAGVGTLVPVNMQKSIEEALAALELRQANQGGTIDSYVAGKLDYTAEQLQEYFSAEQVDAIALAIDALDQNAGFVIGDQTGIGKGRVNAAIIRYAMRTGKTPVFVTHQPNLYADMMRDLTDIGMPKVEPFMTNADLTLDLEGGRKLETPALGKHRQAMRQIHDRLPEDFHAVFTTYNQLQTVKGNKTERQAMVERLAPNAILVLDESHNAGGSGKPRIKDGQIIEGRAEFVRKLIGRASGVFYSSATWAKRPEVMDLYSKTDLRLAVKEIKDLGKIFEKGGVPLQQIVSAMLTKAGQYIRRERSFEGVKFDANAITVDKPTAENISTAMRTIQRLQPYIDRVVKGMKEELLGAGGTTSQDGAVGDTGVTSINFTSLMHNIIDQGLLALKVDDVANEAIAELKADKKVVIAVSNTMGSMIQEYVETHAIKGGDVIGASFNDILLRYLERIRWISVKKSTFAKGKAEKVYITDEQLGEAGREAFKQARKVIEGLDLSKAPISPIDYIKSKIEKAGFAGKIGEITGRTHTVNYGTPKPTYKVRTAKETSKRTTNQTIDAFQNGRIDLIVLNQSGSTGLSLHADKKRASDKRVRKMIVGQAEKNIDTFMQILGRIHRTGQVVLPEFSLSVADVPMENRPAAVLMKKMGSLNANTTASRRSSITDMNIPDFLNEYGDEVAAEMLWEDDELAKKLGWPLKMNEKQDGYTRPEAMRRVTGRIPLLTLKDQAEIYDRLVTEYEALIEQKEALGENALEAKTLELDAKTLGRFEYTGGHPGHRSPFAAASYLEDVDMRRLYRPPPTADIEAEVRKKLPRLGASATREDMEREGRKLTEQMAADMRRKYAGWLEAHLADTDPKEHDGQKKKFDGMADRLESLLKGFGIGSPVVLKTDDGNFYGVVVNVAHKEGATKNPAAPGSYRLTVQTSAFRQEFPLSKLVMTAAELEGRTSGSIIERRESVIGSEGTGSTISVWDSFDRARQVSRENRVVLTGNIVAGYAKAKHKGQIINFKDSEGTVRQGVLMPRGTHAHKLAGEAEIDLPSAENVLKFIGEASNNRATAVTQDNFLRVLKKYGSYEFEVKGSKADGGRYFLNDTILAAASPHEFAGGRGTKTMSIPDPVQALRVIQAVIQAGGNWQAKDHKEAARKLLGLDAPKREEGPAKEARERTGGDTLAPLVIEKADQVLQDLRAELDRLGLKDVEAQIVPKRGKREAVTVFTEMGPIIGVALGTSSTPLNLLRHEALHAMKGLGLFTKQEWSILENMARRTWMAQFDIAKRYGSLTEAEQLEEAIAEGLAYSKDNQPKGVVARVIARITRFLEALTNALKKNGFKTAADVFADIESGAVGARERAPEMEVDGVRHALSGAQRRAIDQTIRIKNPQTIGEKLTQAWRDIRSLNKDAIYQGLIDKFNAIRKLEEGVHGAVMDASTSAWKMALSTQNLPSVMRTVFERGALRYDPATGVPTLIPGSKGLAEIFERLDTVETMDAWMGWAAANRAKRLMSEGREANFSAAQIAELENLHTQPEFSYFQAILDDWRTFNRQTLDFAQAAGLIDPSMRRVWEHDDYVPFYRALESATGPRTKGAIEGQRSGVKRLTGSDEQVNDVIENIVRNTTHLIDASFKNLAMQRAADLGIAGGVLIRERMDWRIASVPIREAKKRLEAVGVDVDTIPASMRDSMLQMFSMVAPKDPAVVSVMRGGKVEYYRVADPLFLASLTAFNHAQLDGIMKVFTGAKKLLTRGVTLTPDFMTKNFVRDSVAAWQQSGESILPLWSSFKGLIKALREDTSAIAIMAGGGGGGGWYNARPDDVSALMKREILQRPHASGARRAIDPNTYLNSVHKIWQFYQRIGEASELANRIAVHDAVRARGGSDAEAIHQARDVLNFSRSGGWAILQTAIQIYPFLNARIQGLDRQYRAFKADPARGAAGAVMIGTVGLARLALTRGGLLTGLSLALWWLYKDDERYKGLEEWDKDSSYHFFLPQSLADQMGITAHYRLPKAFETSALFSTIPERLANAMYHGGREWKVTADRMGKMWSETFSLGMLPIPWLIGAQGFDDAAISAVPQAAKPLVESLANRQAFFGRPIVPGRLKGKLPEDQAQPWTGETARVAGDVFGFSPARIEHLVRGYAGTMGMYVLGASDLLVRQGMDRPPAPSLRVDQLPVLRNFVQSDPPLSTKWVTTFYETANELGQIVESLKDAKKRGDKARVEELQKDHGHQLAVRSQVKNIEDSMADLNRKIRTVYEAKNLTPAEKRERIDRLYIARNRKAREVETVLEGQEKAKLKLKERAAAASP